MPYLERKLEGGKQEECEEHTIVSMNDLQRLEKDVFIPSIHIFAWNSG